MRQLPAGFFVVLLIASAAWAQENPTQANAGPPRLVVDKLNHDFGRLRAGKRETVRIPFRNAGESDLLITGVDAACQCTTLLAEQTRLPPRRSSWLHLGFDSTGMRGPVLKRITLFTNDPERPAVQFDVQAEAMVEVEIAPAEIAVPIVKPGEIIEREVEIFNMSAKPVRLTEIKSSRPEIVIDAKPQTLAPRSVVRVGVRLSIPRDAVGTVSGRIVVRTDAPDYATLFLPVQANVNGIAGAPTVTNRLPPTPTP
ncbi:MAG: DUF1573 domain-containing protein [Myxococcales bacterium]|nr:MAG: DUF1573 domain-containing protein [Myxococcales bacterium]